MLFRSIYEEKNRFALLQLQKFEGNQFGVSKQIFRSTKPAFLKILPKENNFKATVNIQGSSQNQWLTKRRDEGSKKVGQV